MADCETEPGGLVLARGLAEAEWDEVPEHQTHHALMSCLSEETPRSLSHDGRPRLFQKWPGAILGGFLRLHGTRLITMFLSTKFMSRGC